MRNKFGNTKSLLLTLIFVLFLSKVMIAQEPNYTLKDLSPNYRVDWVGNSFSGKKVVNKTTKKNHIGLRRHVQQNVEDLFVNSDGDCYTNSIWDERFAQASIYHAGDLVVVMDNMMGNRKKGGYAVVANKHHNFVAVEVPSTKLYGINRFGNPLQPPAGKTWYGIRRYNNKTGITAGFPNGYGENGGIIVVNTTEEGHIQGLAIDKKRLYVSDTANNEIKVYDLQNLSQEPIDSWYVEKPGKIVIDHQGFLWIVNYGTNKVNRFQPNGKQTSQAITLPENAIAYDLALYRGNRLLVTDMGEDRNIKIYGDINTNPVYRGNFGIKGGLFASEAGKTDNLKFYKPKGVGSDRDGNIYVADDAWSAVAGGGTILSSYKPSGELRWRICSLEFMSGLDIDPGDESALYSKERFYHYDRDKSPGKTTQYQYTTLDPDRYPDDPRLHQHFIGVQMRRLKNKLMFFNVERNGRQIAVFRFDEESDSRVAIPYGMFSLARYKFATPQEPKKKQWIWLDRNFNGQIEPEEFETGKNSAFQIKDKKGRLPKTSDWIVEPNGNLWAVLKTSILKFPISQIENEYPTWNFADVEEYQVPYPFTEARRFFYDAKNDAAYIAGYTEDYPYFGKWKAIGTKLARFDNWSDKPELSWIIDTPWYLGSKDKRQKPIVMDVEGDYVFVGLESTGKNPQPIEQSTVFVYAKASGKYIGSMQQGDSVAPVMLDKGQGLNARQISDGSYLIFLEDAAFARSIIFHWYPT